MTLIGRIIKDIQYSTDLTIEDIALKMGYTREYLQTKIKEGETEKLVASLRDKFWSNFSSDLKIDLLLRDIIELKNQL